MPNIACTISGTVVDATTNPSLDLGRPQGWTVQGVSGISPQPLGFGQALSDAIAGSTAVTPGGAVAGADMEAVITMGGGVEVDTRPLYEYLSDDGTVYAVHMEDVIGAAGGLTPAGVGLPLLPDGYIPRRLTGVDGTGNYIEVPCLATDSRFIGSGANFFVVDGVNYLRSGMIGEKRP